jgi:hypothetical protein
MFCRSSLARMDVDDLGGDLGSWGGTELGLAESGSSRMLPLEAKIIDSPEDL